MALIPGMHTRLTESSLTLTVFNEHGRMQGKFSSSPMCYADKADFAAWSTALELRVDSYYIGQKVLRCGFAKAREAAETRCFLWRPTETTESSHESLPAQARSNIMVTVSLLPADVAAPLYPLNLSAPQLLVIWLRSASHLPRFT